jgi:hypothetical protein
MSPSDILAIVIGGVAGLYAAYRVVMWLTDRAIEAVDHPTRFE